MRDTVNPSHFLSVVRTAVGCTDQQQPGPGLQPSMAERCRRALSALDGYVCGCLWCEMLGDRSGRGGEVVVSAHCAASVVAGVLGDDKAQVLLRLARETQP